jgi:purine-binding chemotaxis protein CheW
MKHPTGHHPETATPRQLVTFSVDRYLFGIEVMNVQEVLRFQEMTLVPLAPPTVRGLINLRGQIITAIDVRRRLGLADSAGSSMMNVVVRAHNETVSLLVDEIGDVVDVSPEQFERTPQAVAKQWGEIIFGVYKLSDRLLLGVVPDQLVVQ